MGTPIICPQCRCQIQKPESVRCPRCNALLVTPCSGSCRTCQQKQDCQSAK